MNTKSKKNGKSQDVVADTANGAQNVAANNVAVQDAPVSESNGKRGRKPSNALTFAKFVSDIRAGRVPDGVHYVEMKIDPQTRMAVYGHWESDQPVLNLDSEGNLQLIRLYTEGKNQTPRAEVIRTANSGQILEFLNSLDAKKK